MYQLHIRLQFSPQKCYHSVFMLIYDVYALHPHPKSGTMLLLLFLLRSYLVPNVRREGEEDVRPAVDLVLVDDLVDHLPRVLPEDDEQHDQDQNPDQIGRQVLRYAAVRILKRKSQDE